MIKALSIFATLLVLLCMSGQSAEAETLLGEYKAPRPYVFSVRVYRDEDAGRTDVRLSGYGLKDIKAYVQSAPSGATIEVTGMNIPDQASVELPENRIFRKLIVDSSSKVLKITLDSEGVPEDILRSVLFIKKAGETEASVTFFDDQHSAERAGFKTDAP